ncbi:MAG: metallophosphoesterase [Bacillota bacterium]
MPKILCSGDLHCFWPTFNRTDEDGIPSRLQDWRRSAQALLQAAIEHKVSAALFPGDFFPTSRPSPAQVLEVAQLFYRFEEEGIRVVGCKGNHDDLGPGQLSPVDLVARMAPDGRRWGWTQPGIERLPDLEVVVLPFTKAVKTDSDPAVAALETSQQLIQIARHWLAMADTSKPIVLMGHWAVSGCRLAAGNSLASTEPTLPLADLQTLPVRAAVMGHIHTPQVIAIDPVVLHTGVLERHDFGEEHNECGCYIVDLDTQEVEFVELPARRFLTVRLDEVALEGFANGEAAGTVVKRCVDVGAVHGAIVRVVYQATEEQAKRVDHNAIIQALYNAGAHQVAGVYSEIIRSERTREASITETTGPLDALEKWLKLRTDLSDDMRSRVAQKARALIEEVRA